MPGPRILEFFSMGEETTWGTASGGTYTGIPWESYGVVNRNIVSPRDKMTGSIDLLHVDVSGQDLAGSAEAEIHPDNATLLLKDVTGIPRVTFDGNPEDIKSYTGRFYDVATRKYYRHLGLKCNQATISCAGEAGELRVSYEFYGKTEEEIASFTAPTIPDQRSFQMKDAWASGASLIKVGDVAEPNIEGFEITIPNNLRLSDRRDDSGFRIACDPGFRGEIGVSATVRGATNWAYDYHALIRTQNTGAKFEFKFNYPGTGSPVDSVTILLRRVVIAEATRQGGPRDNSLLNLVGTAKKQPGFDAIEITIA